MLVSMETMRIRSSRPGSQTCRSMSSSRTATSSTAADSVAERLAILIEVGLGGLGELASSLGDVEDDGSRGSSQLVGEVAMTGGQGQDDAVGKRDEVDGGGVDIESFVVEVHTRYSSAVDAERCRP